MEFRSVHLAGIPPSARLHLLFVVLGSVFFLTSIIRSLRVSLSMKKADPGRTESNVRVAVSVLTNVVVLIAIAIFASFAYAEKYLPDQILIQASILRGPADNAALMRTVTIETTRFFLLTAVSLLLGMISLVLVINRSR